MAHQRRPRPRATRARRRAASRSARAGRSGRSSRSSGRRVAVARDEERGGRQERVDGGRRGRVVLRWMSGWVLIWVCRNSICRLGAVCFFEITPSSSRLRSSAQSARERGRRSGRCLSEGDLMFSETTLSSHKHRFPSSPLSPYHSSTHHSPYLNSLHTALSRSTPLVPRHSH